MDTVTRKEGQLFGDTASVAERVGVEYPLKHEGTQEAILKDALSIGRGPTSHIHASALVH